MNAVCIKCWSSDAVVKMRLTEEAGFECEECGEEFTCAEVRETLEAMKTSWEKLIGWAESYPKE
jgi:transcription initiation factor IIE alpha subunit